MEVSLQVPYEWQLNNASGQGYRECFSSSCAMLARYWGKVGSDDEYNRIRSKYGDTTSSAAQVRALRSLGLDAKFITNGTPELLRDQIKLKRPVAVGWLHEGPSWAPRGGGHWSVIKGFTQNQFIFNDPNGEADVLRGGYVNKYLGAGIRYSCGNWLPRWLVNGPASGWAILCAPRDE